MYATLNTFPPLQSMNSPRGLILGAIVLLHLGFFLLLSSGMGVRIVTALRPAPVMVVPPAEAQPEPTKPTPVQVQVDTPPVWIPRPEDVPFPLDEPPQTVPRQTTDVAPPILGQDSGGQAVAPVVTLPEIDPRLGLSEPPYPASEIRAEHTGTVLLSVYVLENGRIGDVRIDESSGYEKLDQSALREARKWRLKPGMRDGVPVAMWKQIPITFQLQGTGSRRF